MNEHLTYYNELDYWKDVHKGRIKFATKKNSSVIPWDIKCVDPNIPEILNLYNLKTGKMLEIGCGTGYDAKYFFEQGFEVTAIDISEEVIDFAKKIHNDCTINFIAGDFFNIEYKTKFDIVYERGFLHNYKNRLGEIFQRVSYVLEEKGKYIFITGNPNQPPIDSCTPPPVFLGEIEQLSSPWFKVVMAKEIVFKTDENYQDCLGYIFYLEKR